MTWTFCSVDLIFFLWLKILGQNRQTFKSFQESFSGWVWLAAEQRILRRHRAAGYRGRDKETPATGQQLGLVCCRAAGYGGRVTIYAPMIYTALCIMFWMCAYPGDGHRGTGPGLLRSQVCFPKFGSRTIRCVDRSSLNAQPWFAPFVSMGGLTIS